MKRANDSTCGLAAMALVVCFAVQATRVPQAYANCQDRLAEVDASLSESNLDPNTLTVFRQMRDHAAQQCASGNESGAAASLQSIEMLMSSATQASSHKAAQAAEKSATRAQLTRDYLEGTWCSSNPHNGEKGLYTFARDGTYQVLLSDVNYGHGYKGDMEDFWRTFKAVISKEADRFVVGGSEPGTTFDRGQGLCQPTAYRP